ncbi:MAG: hypothetical protein QOE45_271 [Frankiaceae bacterium]|jgi:hypothetical protein|nr:hypothetical protein [Frankiaceae bacterium]
MNRAELRRTISERLAGRQLVWFGTRGDDVEPAAELPELSASFSVIASYGGRPSVRSLALEDISATRVDLDAHDIDEEPRDGPAGELRRAILRTLARPSVVFTYRPSRFLSAICFARQDRCEYLGLFKDHQTAFEHKPWVETEIGRLGVPHIPWTYVADEEQLETLPFLRSGPVMLRRSRTSGGTGLVRVDDEDQVRELWPEQDEAYVSVAPFIDGGVPVNVGAVAWHDGITVHPASVQLIGIPGCSTRPFGYCGNDFGAVAELSDDVLDGIEETTVVVGRWLRRHGYLGAYGVDCLVAGGVPLFTEVNPRFQGSTHASCQLSVEAEESCLVLEHIAALMGMDAPRARPLREQARDAGELSHLVVHWTGAAPGSVDPAPLAERAVREPHACRIDVLTRPELCTLPGATVARITIRDRLTTTGFDLTPTWRGLVDDWQHVDALTLTDSTHDGLAP